MTKFVAYARVSSKMQGIGGYGIDAQKHAVQEYVKKVAGDIVASYAEQESGAKNDRPELLKALGQAKKEKAVLLVARLDRLSRDSAFLITLKKSEVDFRCVDMPECDQFTVSLFAILAERERSLIAARTKVALEAAKRRGVRLGSPNPDLSVRLMLEGAQVAKNAFKGHVQPIIEEIRATGVKTLQGVADCLNRRGISTRQGKTWYPATVKLVMG